jgi:hypothetical protein
MALPSSGQISMDDIRVELGVPTQSPFSLDAARAGTYVTINPCSTYKPPSTGQISLSDWYGYNQTQSCGPTYDYYLATEYYCYDPGGCTVVQRYNVPVAFPTGTGYTSTRYYNDINFDGFLYKITSTSTSAVSIILTTTGANTNCNLVCSV